MIIYQNEVSSVMNSHIIRLINRQDITKSIQKMRKTFEILSEHFERIHSFEYEINRKTAYGLTSILLSHELSKVRMTCVLNELSISISVH